MAGTKTGTAAQITWQALADILPGDGLRDATPAGAVSGVMPAKVLAPADAAQLARALAWANENGVRIVPRGGGTKLEWGNPPVAADAVLSTEKLNRILEHAWEDMTVTVQAGANIGELQRTLAEHGQRLALDPLFPERATVGGVVSANDSGPLRLRFGSVRDLIIGATVALPDGTLARSGGKVVKNVAGYDLPKLMTGALGTLGVITEAVFRLHPLPIQTRTLNFHFADTVAANKFILAVADSPLVPASVQMRASTDMKVTVDVLLEGIEAGISAQLTRLIEFAGRQQDGDDAQVWRAGQRLYDAAVAANAVVCKLSVLPSQLSETAELVRRAAGTGACEFVGQANGLALMRVENAAAGPLAGIVKDLRSQLVAKGGSLVVLHCPAEIKKSIDAWGPCKTQQLALRVKQQFDEKGTLNPGRFVGGI